MNDDSCLLPGAVSRKACFTDPTGNPGLTEDQSSMQAAIRPPHRMGRIVDISARIRDPPPLLLFVADEEGAAVEALIAPDTSLPGTQKYVELSEFRR